MLQSVLVCKIQNKSYNENRAGPLIIIKGNDSAKDWALSATEKPHNGQSFSSLKKKNYYLNGVKSQTYNPQWVFKSINYQKNFTVCHPLEILSN